LTKNVQPEFAPSIVDPFYIVRTGLRRGIAQYAEKLNGKLLDFGCGSKPYRQLFDVDQYLGLDFENEGHSHANEQIDIYYDGRTIPMPDGYFDAVLSSEVFEHVFNLPEILKEINRVMKPGAKILITCPFAWNEHEVPNDFARYSRFGLAHLLEKSGFSIIEIGKSGNFVSTICQLWNLYFFDTFYKRIRNIFPLRWLYKGLIVFPLNLGGVVWGRVFKKNDSFYLNTIILASKIH
jgi:SAM-dependent methyltransferase